MGSVKIDRQANERRLETMFPTDTVRGILALLNNIHHVRELRFYSGDYDASILLIDFERAMIRAGLTRRQRQVIDLVFEKGLTQTEAAAVLGITQQAVNDHILSAARRIANYNRRGKRRRQGGGRNGS